MLLCFVVLYGGVLFGVVFGIVRCSDVRLLCVAFRGVVLSYAMLCYAVCLLCLIL